MMDDDRGENESTLRAPPASIEAEQSVLGALLLDNDAVDRLGDLREQHFFRDDHRKLFAAIMRMIEAGKPADVITVFDALGEKWKDATPLLPYLNALAQGIPSAANIRRYAEIVRSRAVRRELIAACDEVSEMAFAGDESSDEMLDRAGSKLEAIAVARTKREPMRASDRIAEHIAVIGQREEGITGALTTGFAELDERMAGGPRRGELIVIAGRPGMGKTAFAKNIANHVAVDHVDLFCSMEMPTSQLLDRDLASLGRIPLDQILNPRTMAEGNWSRLTAATSQIEALNIYLDDQPGLRLVDVRMMARRLKRKHGLDAIFLDYLQLMEGPGENRNAQIEGITRGLKNLAKELNVVVFLLAQLNRGVESRPNKRPMASDLRDSGSIEQDADAILFLYRDEVYNKESPDRGLAECDIAKLRQGKTGHFMLEFHAAQQRFAPSEKRWAPPQHAGPAPRSVLGKDNE